MQRRPGRVKQAALRLLARRDHSEREFKKKLLDKGYDDDEIEDILSEFKELGYIDDAAFTERQVRYLACGKLYGNRRIDMQLRDKGLPREQIRQAIEAVRREFSEAQALTVRLEKTRNRQQINNPAEKRRLLQSLARQGFPPALIFEMIDTIPEE